MCSNLCFKFYFEIPQTPLQYENNQVHLLNHLFTYREKLYYVFETAN